MKFLISTEADDSHAIIVKLALENSGHQVRLLLTADQPTKLKNSIFVSSSDYEWTCSDDFETLSDNNYDVVWWRRPTKPYLPKGITHENDRRFAIQENVLFYESLTTNMAADAWWINSKDSATRANSKLVQLKLASEVGMLIPPTLCSNNPEEIRNFIAQYEAEGVIYKPLSPPLWFEESCLKIGYTVKISSLDLPKDKLLQLFPGIFQKEIKKKYELRVTCFGDYLVAAKLNSQTHPQGKIDWREIPSGHMSIESYQLPAKLAAKIRLFMKRMGLVFGCLDFIVSEDGDYVFLEVNEQGQFLWIEAYNPDFHILDIFIQFLLNKSSNYFWEPKKCSHKISNYQAAMEKIVKENRQRHVNLNLIP